VWGSVNWLQIGRCPFKRIDYFAATWNQYHEEFNHFADVWACWGTRLALLYCKSPDVNGNCLHYNGSNNNNMNTNIWALEGGNNRRLDEIIYWGDSWFILAIERYQGSRIKEIEMGAGSGRCRKKKKKCIQNFVRSLTFRDHLEVLGLGGRVILKWILNK